MSEIRKKAFFENDYKKNGYTTQINSIEYKSQEIAWHKS